jgi:hypothetical protein
MFSEADLRYIHANFVPLDDLLARRRETPQQLHELIEHGVLPRPSYVLDDATEMFPPSYFAFYDSAAGPDEQRPTFERRYRAAAAEAGIDPDPDDWDNYLSGVYGICLNEVTPETIVTKARLIETIESLMAEPRAGDAAWRQQLRAAVDELDELERPFCDYDRAQAGGSVSRDRCVTAPRVRYPNVFAEAPVA